MNEIQAEYDKVNRELQCGGRGNALMPGAAGNAQNMMMIPAIEQAKYKYLEELRRMGATDYPQGSPGFWL